jgi:hypothetical protein
MQSLREAPGREGRAGDGHRLRPMQDPERGVKPLTVKTKDWKAGRRWAARNAIATPGVTYTIVRNGRYLSYRYEDGLMYCTGHGKRVEPYSPGLGRLTASEPMC